MISFQIDDEQRLVQQSARRFAGEVLRQKAREAEEIRGVPEAVIEAWHSVGLAALGLPDEAGGAGQGLVTQCIVAEELGAGDAAIAVTLPGLDTAWRFLGGTGEGDAAQRWLEPYARQPGWRGSWASGWSRGIRLQDAGGVLSLAGQACHVAGFASPGYIVVTALLASDEPALVVLPEDRTAAARGKRAEILGLHALEVGELSFAACEVAPGEVIARGSEAIRVVQRGLLEASLVRAAIAVGLARAAFDYALAYANDRVAFGKPVSHFQAVAFSFADLAMDIDAARWLVWRAAAAPDVAEDPSAACMAIAEASALAMRAADHAVQVLGGAGYMRDHLCEKWMRDAKTLQLLAITAEQADVMAGAALAGVPLDAAVLPPWDGAQEVIA